MVAAEQQQEALERAANGESVGNYAAIYDGFEAMGLSEADIQPRVNVFTYNAWKALGRQVKRGEHGVKVRTYVPIRKNVKDERTGEDERKVVGQRRKVATVFHVTQTEQV